jgi:hypothetical protein
MVLAITNGILRQFLYSELMGELAAHQLSTFTGLLLIFLAVWLINKKWKMESAIQALYIGLIWLAITILFEFVFGHFVIGHTWDRLFADYNILAGRIWILFLAGITFMPTLVFRLDNTS